MLNSVLLHLNGMEHGQSVIECGVGMAQRWEARVRGLTLLDTRRLATLTSSCESAAYADGECQRLHLVERQQGDVRSQLTQACLSAGVDFDVRRMQGDPFDLLPPESQFHDLMVTYLPPPGEADELQAPGMNAAELVNLLIRGVQPMLIVRRPRQELRRVLLAYDGTPASGQAIRQFLQQGLIDSPECRLLAIGQSADRARENLREMTEYCRQLRLRVETGSLCGAVRRVLVPYAQKWSADLVVMGISRGSWALRKFWGAPAQRLLARTDMAVYATA